MPKLKPISKDDELSAIPVDEPVLVELEPVASGAEPEGDGIIEPEPKPAKIEKPDPDAGAKVLQAQMEEMRKTNERLAREADEARRDARDARAGQADTESDLIANALQAAQRERDAAKLAVKTAFENSDAEGMADAQERVGRAAADIREYERATAAQASEREREKAAPVQQHQPNDINSVVDRMNVLPSEKDWLKAHPDAIMDGSRNKELDVAYMKATRKSLIRGTPEYFKFIESEMGYQTQQADDNGGDERNTIVSAPVSRDSRSSLTGRATNPNQIYLSPEERDIARSMGISDKAYALGKKQLNAAKTADPEKYGMRG